MNRIPVLGLVAVTLTAATPTIAQSPFNGSFSELQGSRQFSTVPSVNSLKDGEYTCTTCNPAYTIPADGKPHALPEGHAYEKLAVTIVDPNTLEFQYWRDSEVARSGTQTASADGSTLSFTTITKNSKGGAPLKGTGTEKRVGSPVPGEHAATGSWVTTSYAPPKYVRTYKIDGDTITESDNTGGSYTATLGGDFVPVAGDGKSISVAASMSGPNRLIERYKTGDALSDVMIFDAAPDGKMLNVMIVDLEKGAASSLKVTRQ